MILLDFLKNCKKLTDENPDAFFMEMFACHGASGVVDELSHPRIELISDWDDSDMPVREMLPRNYTHDSVISVYTGN